jgi:hypothetical protein
VLLKRIKLRVRSEKVRGMDLVLRTLIDLRIFTQDLQDTGNRFTHYRKRQGANCKPATFSSSSVQGRTEGGGAGGVGGTGDLES